MSSKDSPHSKLSTCSGSKLIMVNVLKIGIYKMLVRIANSEDPDQTASWEAV